MENKSQTDFDIFIRHYLTLHKYAVVDRLNVFPAPWFQGAPMIPLVPRELQSDADDLPALLPIDPDAGWFPNLLEEFAVSNERDYPPPFWNLLVVPDGLGSESLAAHLTKRLIIQFPGGKGYLRYFDPKNFVHFKRFLSPAHLRELYGPIIRWSIYFDKRWITEPASSITKTLPIHWAVNAKQFAALDRLRVLNQALFYWREELDRPWESLDEFRAYADLADALVVQEQRVQPDARDETIVSAVASQFPQDFHFNPNQFQ